MLLAPVPRGRLRSLGTCRGGRAGPGTVLQSQGCREKGNEKKSRAPSLAPAAGRHACWPRPDRRARCQLRGHRRSLSTALRSPAAPANVLSLRPHWQPAEQWMTRAHVCLVARCYGRSNTWKSGGAESR